VVGALAVSTAASLVLVVVAIDGALFVALLGIALTGSRPTAPVPAEAQAAT
jgi:hypothetical protein